MARVAPNKRAVTTPAKMTTVTAARVVNSREAMALVKMTLVPPVVNRLAMAPPVKMTATVPLALQAVNNKEVMALAKTTATVLQVRQAVNKQVMAPLVKTIQAQAPETKEPTAALETNKTHMVQAKTIHTAVQVLNNRATTPPSKAIHTAVPVANKQAMDLPAKMTLTAAATPSAILAIKEPVVLPAADNLTANLMIRMDPVIRVVD